MKRKEFIKHLKEIVSIATVSISSQKELNNTPKDLYIASFCSSIIQYTDAIISLIENNKLIAVPPILRSMLEAYVELINLCNNENYTHALNSIYLEHTIKNFHNACDDSDNPFLQHMIQYYDDLGKEIKDLKKQKAQVDKNFKFKGNINKIKTRFELAGLGNAYVGIYGQLCEDSHNGLIQVESRHLIKKENRTEFSVKTHWNLEEISHHVLTAIDILKSSLINTYKHLNFKDSDKYIEKIESQERLVNSYFKEQYS